MKRSYRAGLRFSGTRKEKRQEEVAANQRIRRWQQIVQNKIVEKDMVSHAYVLIDQKKHNGIMGASILGKVANDRTNIGQVSCRYALSAVNEALDREKKLSIFLNLLQNHPRDALSWLVFNRSPFLESLLSQAIKSKFEYSRNLVLSAGRLHSQQVQILLPDLSTTDIIVALDTFILEIEKAIEDRKERATARVCAFLNKLLFLKKHQHFFSMCLFHWLQYQRTHPDHPPWRSLKTLARHFSQMLGHKRKRHLFSAIRGTLLLALSSHYDETVQDILRSIKVRDLVAKPYQRKRKKLAPVDLVMGYKYIVTRPGNAKIMTQLAQKYGQFTLGIRNPDKQKDRVIEAELIISKSIKRMLERGASITSLRIRSGSAPSHKVLVDIIMEGPEQSFVSTHFLVSYPQITRTQTGILGLDVNKVGSYILVFSEKIQIPEILLKLTRHYNHLGKVLSQLSKAISRNEKSGSKPVKLSGERLRVYKRRKNILSQIKHQCRMLTTAVLVQTGANRLNVEDLELSARGKRGALAKAILNMPDELDIFEQAVLLASIYTGVQIELKTVNPRGTSSKHYACGGRLLRKLGLWDIAPCNKCGKMVNTHYSAAQFIKEGGLYN